MFIQLFALDDLENFQRHGAGQRRAAKGRGVRARPQQIRIRRAHPERADGKSAAERLGHRKAVGQKLFAAGNAFQNPLEALESSGPEMAALHAVHEQQQFFLVAQARAGPADIPAWPA